MGDTCVRCQLELPDASAAAVILDVHEGGRLLERDQLFCMHWDCASAQCDIELAYFRKKYASHPDATISGSVEWYLY
jgi:hypothetical protein